MVTTNITSRKRQITRVGAALSLALIAISACGSKETTDGFETGALIEICPQVIRIQTDWFPEAEHGGFYAAKVHGIFEKYGLDVELQPPHA